MDKLLEILQEMHPDVDFESEDNLIEDGIIDSFDIVYLISQISEEYDVRIGAEYITPENFASAETIWDLIKRLEEED